MFPTFLSKPFHSNIAPLSTQQSGKGGLSKQREKQTLTHPPVQGPLPHREQGALCEAAHPGWDALVRKAYSHGIKTEQVTPNLPSSLTHGDCLIHKLELNQTVLLKSFPMKSISLHAPLFLFLENWFFLILQDLLNSFPYYFWLKFKTALIK